MAEALPPEATEARLDMLGRLLACSRQLDMYMADEASMRWYVNKFLAVAIVPLDGRRTYHTAPRRSLVKEGSSMFGMDVSTALVSFAALGLVVGFMAGLFGVGGGFC